MSSRAKSRDSDARKIRAATIADAQNLVPLFEQLGYPSEENVVRERIAKLNPASQVFLAESHVVADDRRNTGVGTGLLIAAENWARERGASVMHLTSNVVRERAHAFYGRCGYSTIKSERVFEKNL